MCRLKSEVVYSFICLIAVSSSFAPTRLSFGGSILRIATTTTDRFSSSSSLLQLAKEDEIARLQEQIRKLQEEEDASDERQGKAAAATSDSKPAGLADKRSADLERVRGKDMPFSEGDLIDANIIPSDGRSNGLSSVLPAILLTIGAIVFFVAFSQVPVGQEDFARYSVAPATQIIDLGDLNPDKKSI